MTLNEICDRLVEHARNVYAAGDITTQLIPTVEAELKNGDEIVMAIIPWRNDSDKAQALAMVKRLFIEKDVVRYAIMSEAWVAEYTLDEVAAGYQRMPRDREDRKEVVNIAATDVTGAVVCRSYEIDRDADGKPSVGKLLEYGTDDDIKSGLMLELLR